jgi:hypothetical protein
MQNQSVFRLLDWILHYTLFHGFDTLVSHLREEGSLDYDGGLVRLQVQRNLHSSLLWNFNKRLDPISRWVLPFLSLAFSDVR